MKSVAPSKIQKLGYVSNTDKIIRNAGKLIASNSNQVIDYIESQVKSKSVAPSEIQKLGDVSNTDKILRNAGKLIASNSNQVIDYIESQVKSKVEAKSPETSISINLLLVQSSTGVNFWSWYHPCRQIFANRYGKIWYQVFKYTSIEISKVNDILEIGPHSSKTYDVANQILSMQNKSDQEILKILKKCLLEEQSQDISAACIGGINSITSIFAEPPAYDKIKSSNPQRIQDNSPNQETRFSKPQNIEPQVANTPDSSPYYFSHHVNAVFAEPPPDDKLESSNPQSVRFNSPNSKSRFSKPESIEPQNIEPQIANTPDSSPGSSFDFVEPYEEVVEAPEFDEDVEIASVCYTYENEVGTPEHDSDEERGPVCSLTLANTPDSSPGPSFDFVEPYEEVVEAPEYDEDVEICYLNRLELIPNIQVNSVRSTDSTSPLLEPSEGTYTEKKEVFSPLILNSLDS